MGLQPRVFLRHGTQLALGEEALVFGNQRTDDEQRQQSRGTHGDDARREARHAATEVDAPPRRGGERGRAEREQRRARAREHHQRVLGGPTGQHGRLDGLLAAEREGRGGQRDAERDPHAAPLEREQPEVQQRSDRQREDAEDQRVNRHVEALLLVERPDRVEQHVAEQRDRGERRSPRPRTDEPDHEQREQHVATEMEARLGVGRARREQPALAVVHQELARALDEDREIARDAIEHADRGDARHGLVDVLREVECVRGEQFIAVTRRLRAVLHRVAHGERSGEGGREHRADRELAPQRGRRKSAAGGDPAREQQRGHHRDPGGPRHGREPGEQAAERRAPRASAAPEILAEHQRGEEQCREQWLAAQEGDRVLDEEHRRRGQRGEHHREFARRAQQAATDEVRQPHASDSGDRYGVAQRGPVLGVSAQSDREREPGGESRRELRMRNALERETVTTSERLRQADVRRRVGIDDPIPPSWRHAQDRRRQREQQRERGARVVPRHGAMPRSNRSKTKASGSARRARSNHWWASSGLPPSNRARPIRARSSGDSALPSIACP
jgi:hypothetical protein